MTYHNWGEKDFDWKGLDEAARYIGENLQKWGRINVTQWKEKFGTVRVYCSLGWYSLFSLTHPGYHWVPKHMRFAAAIPLHWLNFLVVPIHARIYRHFYKQAVKKWPHLTAEILCCADWDEYLHGLGYDFKRDEIPEDEA